MSGEPKPQQDSAQQQAQPENNKQVDALAKSMEDNFKKFSETLTNLNSKVESLSAPAPAKQEPTDKLEDLIILDPAKAIERIKSEVRNEVISGVNAENKVKEEFSSKFYELQGLYPEIADQSSALHKRAKELMDNSKASPHDSGALERAVLRAAAEEGVLPMSHRKAPVSDDDNEPLGGASYTSSNSRRRSSSQKLDQKTLAFAELAGMDVKDPKVIENLTKTQNERRGNWRQYR